MDLMPILSTLRRHKTAATLIVLEIALTSAIVCNALHLIGVRLERLTAQHGLPEAELLVLTVRGTRTDDSADGKTAQDLQQLRALPGVKAVAVANQVIYGRNSNNTTITRSRDKTDERFHSAQYSGDEALVDAMGLKLVAGRNFKPEEYQFDSRVDEAGEIRLPQIIISRALAEDMFPGTEAVGKTLYAFGAAESTVIGVVDRLPHPYPGRADGLKGYAMLLPWRPSYRGGSYILRVDPAQQDAVLKAAPGVIEGVDATRIVDSARRLTEMRSAFYAQDRAMAWLMGGVIVALMLVTAFGIVGLASFWVQQRTRMIGTRRALGATRGQILRYFQLENFLLSGFGIVLGMAGALGLSLLLMAQYELPRLPWLYLPAGALALWALGQIAVLAPARRAAALPPVAALRS
jgi:putative ABC transport system permease protein